MNLHIQLNIFLFEIGENIFTLITVLAGTYISRVLLLFLLYF